jgi:release factor glutamine methyltransferase
MLAEAHESILSTVHRRLAREPVSRIVGARAFWGRMFRVSPATLDPRPDSETLVAAALEVVAGRAVRILDLGTGTGCLLLSLLAELPGASGVGVDISAEALLVARENARDHGLSERSEFLEGDWGRGLLEPFDLIVCNPPYIRQEDLVRLQPEVTNFDPALALDGGPDGLAAYRSLLRHLPPLAPAASILFEVGAGQSAAVAGMLQALFNGSPEAQIRSWPDLSGIQRVVGATTQMSAKH